MKCNYCKNLIQEGDGIYCSETKKFYCDEICREKDLKCCPALLSEEMPSWQDYPIDRAGQFKLNQKEGIMNQQKALEFLRVIDKMAGRSSLITIKTETSQNGSHQKPKSFSEISCYTGTGLPAIVTAKYDTLGEAVIEAARLLMKEVAP